MEMANSKVNCCHNQTINLKEQTNQKGAKKNIIIKKKNNKDKNWMDQVDGFRLGKEASVESESLTGGKARRQG